MLWFGLVICSWLDIVKFPFLGITLFFYQSAISVLISACLSTISSKGYIVKILSVVILTSENRFP